MQDTSLKRERAKRSITLDDLKLDGNSKKEAQILTNTVRNFSRGIIIMGFGISKCAHVTIKAGKPVSVGEIKLSSGAVIL